MLKSEVLAQAECNTNETVFTNETHGVQGAHCPVGVGGRALA